MLFAKVLETVNKFNKEDLIIKELLLLNQGTYRS